MDAMQATLLTDLSTYTRVTHLQVTQETKRNQGGRG